MWIMLFASLAVNECFAWKAVHVDYQSVAPTVNVCSFVGLVESARSSMRLNGSICYLGGPIRNVRCPNSRFVFGPLVVCQNAIEEVSHLPLSYFGAPRLGHVGSRCVARADLPRSSVVQGHSSTL
ncbi:hypothetical protein ACFX2K_035739 [Malus domestica]